MTSVASGAGLKGGPITKTGTLSIATAGVTDAMLANAYSGVGTCAAGKVVSALTRDAVPTCTTAGAGTVTGVTAGTDLTGGGTSGTVTLNLDTTKVPTLAAAANVFSGSVTASAFSGNGSALTSLNPANLASGTAGISITGNAATATTAGIATTATTAGNATNLGGVAASSYARLDVGNSFTGDQSVSGNVSATGSVSGGTASFTGALSGMTAAFSGALTAAGTVLPATGAATATQGFTSNPLDLLASSFNSGTSVAVPQLFRWEAEPAGNNTASPSGTLNLLYLSGAGTPVETGLSIASNGQITFAASQTYPGTTVSVAAPLTGNGTTGSPLSLPLATGSNSGYLASSDWTAFNNKLTSVSGLNGIGVGGVSGGTQAIYPNYGGATGDFGTATTLARSDHVHDSRYLLLVGGTLIGALTGTSATFSGNISLPQTSGSSAGVINLGNASLHACCSSYTHNIFLGQSAGNFTMGGDSNNAIGYQSLSANTWGAGNNALGSQSLQANTSGSANNAIGRYSLMKNVSGGSNEAFGSWTLFNNTTGGGNTAIGNEGLYYNQWGAGNTAIGANTLVQTNPSSSTATDGSYNTALGYQAGNGNYAGVKNTFIGYNAVPGNSLGNLTNATAIGANAVVSQNNSLVLGATQDENGNPLQTNVGIGTSTPQKPLDVAASGGIRISRTESASSNNEILFQDNGQIRSSDNNHRIIFNRSGNEIELREYGQITFSPNAASGTRTALAWIDTGGNMHATSFPTTSSRRFKTNIAPLQGALEKVQSLQGVSYDLKSNGQHQIGLIAEDVGKVVPEVVAYEKNGVDAQGVDYGRLTALLIEATKEQQALIQKQAEENQAQQVEIEKQRAEIKAQQSRLEAQQLKIAQLASQVGVIQAALAGKGATRPLTRAAKNGATSTKTAEIREARTVDGGHTGRLPPWSKPFKDPQGNAGIEATIR